MVCFIFQALRLLKLCDSRRWMQKDEGDENITILSMTFIISLSCENGAKPIEVSMNRRWEGLMLPIHHQGNRSETYK